jgi:hypothetical protein
MQTILRTTQTTLFVNESVEEIQHMLEITTTHFITVHEPVKNRPIIININTITLVSVIDDDDEM